MKAEKFKTEYSVVGKREVPVAATYTGLITGKKFTESFVNGGQKAICVKLANEKTAWGFAATFEDAEINAVKNAIALA